MYLIFLCVILLYFVANLPADNRSSSSDNDNNSESNTHCLYSYSSKHYVCISWLLEGYRFLSTHIVYIYMDMFWNIDRMDSLQLYISDLVAVSQLLYSLILIT